MSVELPSTSFINLFPWGTEGENRYNNINVQPSTLSESIVSINLQSILKTNIFAKHTLMGHEYEFELYIVNSSGKILPISPTAIKNLTISNNLTQCWTEGSIIISNDNEWIEYIRQFPFRNDGEDFLRFRLLPLNDSTYNTNLNITKKFWELNYIFSIYDIHDVTPTTKGSTDASSIKKFKKIFFRDVRQHFLLTQNIEYSTAQSKLAPINNLPLNNSNRYSDTNRSIPTGSCINEFIKKAFNNDPVLSITGVDKNPSQDWDSGSTNIFYTSGAGENCMSDLMYLVNRHVGEAANTGQPDACILDIERDSGNIGYLTLKPLSRYFSRAGNTYNTPGPDQIEHFFLKQDFDKSTTPTKKPRAPILTDALGNPTNNMTQDIKINDFNIIDKYEFVDISPQINATFLNQQPVYSFDFAQRRFNIEFAGNTIDYTQKFIKEKYLSGVYTSRSTNTFLTPNITPTKILNRNINPIFSLYGDGDDQFIRLPDVLLKMLKTSVFQNTCINFTVPGLSFRQAGKFIGIDRLSGSDDNILDNKLCGQWFVVDVQHIIAAGNYYNNITAVKIHRYA